MLEIEMLTSDEARVLGTLVEKSQATPDYYPMTLSALKAACNQKTCREPVSQFDEATLSAALSGLKRKTLVVFIPYGNQPNYFKYRHFLEDIRYDLTPPQLAILSVLLLRGAQTLNEIKLRTTSQNAFDSVEAVETCLLSLAKRETPLAEKLEKRPGWKEPRWRHRLFAYAEGEIGWVSGDGDYELKSPAEPSESQVIRGENQVSKMAERSENPPKSQEWMEVQEELAVMKAELAELRNEVEQLKSALGG